jgi:hypothetical protein
MSCERYSAGLLFVDGSSTVCAQAAAGAGRAAGTGSSYSDTAGAAVTGSQLLNAVETQL